LLSHNGSGVLWVAVEGLLFHGGRFAKEALHEIIVRAGEDVGCHEFADFACGFGPGIHGGLDDRRDKSP
jgi:hypothetical protein